MWGNTIGWIIAAVLGLIITVGAVGFGISFNRLTPPTKFGKDPKNLAELSLDPKPSSIVAMGSASDAGPLLMQAIADVKANPKKYDAFLASGKAADAAKLPAVKAILDTASMSSMKLFSAKPATDIDYFPLSAHPDLAVLGTAAKCVENAGLLYTGEKKYKEAKRFHEAQFSLGAKMFAERAMFMEAFQGLGQMRAAAECLKSIAQMEKDDARVAQLDAFLRGSEATYKERMEPMWKVINSVDGKVIARHAGDIYHFANAEHQKERMWRVESVLKLGRFKFSVGTDGHAANQSYVPARLEELQKDPDPLVAEAAKKAANLSQVDYNTKIR